MMYRLSENVQLNVSAPHKQTLPGALGGDVVVTYETSLLNVNINIMDGGGNEIYSDTLATLDARADAFVWQHLAGHFQIALKPAFFTAMSAADGGFGVSLSKSGASGWHMTGAAFFRGGAYEALAVALAAVKTETDKLGAPAGASHAADVAAVKTAVDAVKTKTDNLPTNTATTLAGLATAADLATVDGVVDAIKVKTDNLPANTAVVLGTPAGVSLAADIAAAKGDTAAIKIKTDNLPANTATELTGLNNAIGSCQDVATTAAGWAEQSQIAAAAVKVKTDNLPADTAAVLDGLATSSELSALATATDLATAKTAIDLIKTRTDNLPADTAAVLGAPAGASLSADVAAVKSVVDGIDASTGAAFEALAGDITAVKTKTDNLPADTAAVLDGLATAADLATVDGVVDGIAAQTSSIDELLGTVDANASIAAGVLTFRRVINAELNRLELYDGETLRAYWPLYDASGNPTSSKTAVVDQGAMVIVE